MSTSFCQKILTSSTLPFVTATSAVSPGSTSYRCLSSRKTIIGGVTEEEAAAIKTFLGSLNRTAFIDNNVENIIAEEAAAFFEGQKSAEDVASVIQSRVKIYINENS